MRCRDVEKALGGEARGVPNVSFAPLRDKRVFMLASVASIMVTESSQGGSQ
jgi:hypothetical protein